MSGDKVANLLQNLTYSTDVSVLRCHFNLYSI